MTLLDRVVATSLPRLPRSVVERVARRYISGDDLESALVTTARLNRAGMSAALDVLGENVGSEEEAGQTVRTYERVLEELRVRGLDGNISLKLTHLGLRLDRERCLGKVRMLLERAAPWGGFVRIDMEDSSTTNDTLAIYRSLRGSHENVGVALQAYLRRSEADARELAAIGARVRVCKGIYREPPEIAYQDREGIRRSFLRLVEILLSHGCHVGIATHDEVLVEGAFRILEKLGGCEGHYEFQMLLGVRERLRDSIVGAGHPLRVYVPFGREWYDYSVRRLRENPRIAGHVLRAVLGLAR